MDFHRYGLQALTWYGRYRYKTYAYIFRVYLRLYQCGNCNGRTQGGSNAEIVIADAFVKGLPNIDYHLALEAMLKDATIPPGGNEEAEGRGGLIPYLELGYIPYGIPRAGNRTIEYSYCDYAIALVAKGLGKTDLYQQYLKQSSNWKNLWRADYEHAGSEEGGFIIHIEETLVKENIQPFVKLLFSATLFNESGYVMRNAE